MLVSTILNLIFIPVLYVLVKSGLELFSRKSSRIPVSTGAAQL